jgi:hypothetical protein
MSIKKKTAKKSVKKVKKDKPQPAGRKSAFSGKKINKVAKENPRRKGSIGFKSFALIKNGMTYEQYLEAGGRRQDLAFDLTAGHVKLSK